MICISSQQHRRAARENLGLIGKSQSRSFSTALCAMPQNGNSNKDGVPVGAWGAPGTRIMRCSDSAAHQTTVDESKVSTAAAISAAASKCRCAGASIGDPVFHSIGAYCGNSKLF